MTPDMDSRFLRMYLSANTPATATTVVPMTSPAVTPHQIMVRDIMDASPKHMGTRRKLRSVVAAMDHSPLPTDWNRLEVSIPIMEKGRNRHPILTKRTISSDRVYANIGELSNRGIELNIESDNIRAGQFNWHTSFNISHNRNIIEKLYNGVSTRFSDYTIWMEGYDRDTYYLVDWAGVDPSDGSPMWHDIDGNLTKTYNSNNRKPGKSASPILTGGIINTFTYRNWALSFQINYDIGGYALPSYARFYFRDGLNIIDGNQAVEVYYDRWKAPGQLASFPKVSQTSTDSWQGSTRFLYDKTNFPCNLKARRLQ